MKEKEVYTELQISFYSIISFINYYFMIILIAILYDVNEQLAGGPASMTAIVFGPFIAIFLAIITYLLLMTFKRKGKLRLLEVGILFHLILIFVNIAIILVVLLSD
ncbi:hypothetical protein [Gottfriedia solisilvae]|uniref:Uncharacterized protein n=1 Tax=Gottfriedia solisilvae TaxID=1516104 RepID=A0A8J3AQ17_9BACI|nr:hypothetical protein [Gottfriedia solisilvae]GGI18053.1 hypothetical protein GCM10007380_41010 [Gottfriedia solisilvae]